MATSPIATVLPTPTKAATFIGHWINFIKAHERLLLAIIAAVVLFHFADKAYDAYGNHLKANQTQVDAQIASVNQQNAQLQQKLDLLKATVDANAKLDDAKIAAAKQKLVVVQQVDAALPLPELSAHWQDLLSLNPGSITPQANGTVAVTTDAAHTTVSKLEIIPALQDQLAATQDKLTGCTTVRAQQDTQITGLNNAITLEKNGREADAKVAKQAQRTSYLKGLKHGIIIGVVGTTAAFVAIFH